MLFWILLSIGIAGFGLAAYWDLKTTEFPDWLPYSIIGLGLGARVVFSLLTGEWRFLVNSMVFGLAFLGMGLAMYFMRQWGDGDAWLLGALGFLFPDSAGYSIPHAGLTAQFPFPLVLLFNFFITAFCYLIAYSIALGAKNRKKTRKFLSELRSGLKGILSIVALFTAASTVVVLYLSLFLRAGLNATLPILLFPGLVFFMTVFMRYGRFVEANLFRKRIPVGRLRPGDVLVSDRWRGITEKEIEKLRRKGGHVWIKEGVRFAPVFLITILVTLFYGNLMGLFLI